MSNMTKNALSASLIKLMETKRLDRITVKEITEGCGLNRHTFYYHFRDIYDLLEWSTVKMFEQSSNAIRTLQWPDRFTYLLRLLANHRTYVMNAMRSVQREWGMRFLEDRVEDWVIPAVNARLKDNKDAALIALTCKTLLSHTAMRWLEGGMVEPPEDVTEELLYAIKKLPDTLPDAVRS